MAKKFSELQSKMSPGAQRRSQAAAARILANLPLQGLRRARRLSQETLAEALNATQPEVSKIERRADLYISTLRRYIEAMGGALDIIARFPDGDFRVSQFHEVGNEKPDLATAYSDTVLLNTIELPLLEECDLEWTGEIVTKAEAKPKSHLERSQAQEDCAAAA
jgi:transcriptional regulator with XRE-family HTH domain